MEQQKLANQKEALAFLCSRYPKCFFTEGPVKPLKIGIFQDIASDLAGTELVSKRLIRMSLRHYTSSWRYLAAVKAEVARIDLLGEEGDKVEQQHADHAAEQLKESKQKAAKNRENNPKTAKKPPSKHKGYTKPQSASANDQDNSHSSKSGKDGKTKASKNTSKQRKPAAKPNKPIAPQVPITDNEIVVGANALVKLGKEPMPVTITDISKDGIAVQLKSGMTVKVKQAQLFSIQKANNK